LKTPLYHREVRHNMIAALYSTIAPQNPSKAHIGRRGEAQYQVVRHGRRRQTTIAPQQQPPLIAAAACEVSHNVPALVWRDGAFLADL
jgi:hypothetical protein